MNFKSQTPKKKKITTPKKKKKNLNKAPTRNHNQTKFHQAHIDVK